MGSFTSAVAAAEDRQAVEQELQEQRQDKVQSASADFCLLLEAVKRRASALQLQISERASCHAGQGESLSRRVNREGGVVLENALLEDYVADLAREWLPGDANEQAREEFSKLVNQSVAEVARG